MKLFAVMSLLWLSFGASQAYALERSELPQSAYTVGKGTMQVHPGLNQSSYGLSENMDLRTRILGQYFGFNAQLKIAVLQDDDSALSIEPGMWTEWPWAPLGFPSYSVGGMARYTMAVGDGRLNLGLGAYYDVLKVTFRFLQGEEFDAERGIELTPEYSVTLFRSPMVFGHDAEQRLKDGEPDGWDFSGIRVPITVGYEHPTSETTTWNFVMRAHPLNLMNGGSWGMEMSPSWNHAMGDKFRLGLGLNLVYPGNPLPVADEELANEIARAEDSRDFQFWLNSLPEMPVAPLPYVALWWRI